MIHFIKNSIYSFLVLCCFLLPGAVCAQSDFIPDEFFRAEVLDIDIVESESGVTGPLLRVQASIISDERRGETIQVEDIIVGAGVSEGDIEDGDTIIVVRSAGAEGEAVYYFADHFRLPAIIMILGLFIIVAIVFAKKQAVFALGGLGVSILVLMQFMLPQIAEGRSPLMIGIITAAVISVVTLYMAHGYNTRTHLALSGILATLLIAVLLSVVFVYLAQLVGYGSEEVYYLQLRFSDTVDFRGLLLAGIIIGTLGVLDDVATALVATVAEISSANPELPASELYKRGLNVGREHIASLINTLVLAYAGTALPLLLLFTVDTQPLWVKLNGQLLSEEIVRTIVGSIALILAVPITTAIAASYIAGAAKKGRVFTSSSRNHSGHSH